eukprot:TRINITY_DN17382_c0_g1_i5.p1 TRINITY_DN17382_c0_g1~~TRINITY_DN17382_c0_g1_i5.p1  ORF type:complete len:799 (+),score=91.42 TRINITY_DN17382_c0_g1_i5:127-2523(+)
MTLFKGASSAFPGKNMSSEDWSRQCGFLALASHAGICLLHTYRNVQAYAGEAASNFQAALVCANMLGICLVAAAIYVVCRGHRGNHLEGFCIFLAIYNMCVAACWKAQQDKVETPGIGIVGAIVYCSLLRMRVLPKCLLVAAVMSAATLIVRVGPVPGIRVVDDWAVQQLVFVAVPQVFAVAFSAVLEKLWHTKKELRTKLAVNGALTKMLCDGSATLCANAQTILESDLQFDGACGGPATGCLLADFITAADQQRFADAIRGQTWPAPALLNVTLNTLDGRSAEVELLMMKCHESNNVAEPVKFVMLCVRNIAHCLHPATTAQALAVATGIPMSSGQGRAASSEKSAGHFTVTTEKVFRAKRHGNVEGIIELGRKEHWYIEPSRLDTLGNGVVIGSGGFGTVIQATLDGATVACKLAKTRGTRENATIAEELRTMRHLRHPCIVAFLGASVLSESKDLVIIYEYVNGSSLKNFAGRRRSEVKRVDFQDIQVLFCIACALCYMHSQENPVLHGDLTPANVMVTKIQDRYMAKLLDFGLSRVSPQGVAHVSGKTVRWAPPEVVVHCRLTCRSDIYALGCLACMVLTNTVAHHDLVPGEIQLKLSTRSGSPFYWDDVKQLCVQNGVDGSLYELLQSTTDYEEAVRPDAAAASKVLVDNFRMLYSPTLDKKCELGAQALDATIADSERHSDDSLIVWLCYRQIGLETWRKTLQHCTSKLSLALGGMPRVWRCVHRSVELMATIDTVVNAAGMPCQKLPGERVEGHSAVVLVAKQLHVIYRAEGNPGDAIVKIAFAEPVLEL